MPKHDSCRLSAVEAGDTVTGPLTVRASTHVMLSPWPICPRQTGGPPHLSLEERTPQELPTMCSMIAVVETDGVRGR